MRSARRLLVLVLSVLAIAMSTAVPASAAGDDYPWRLDQTWSADRYGFTKRQCTSFVAWRLAQRLRPISASQGWGNAYHWDDKARQRGVTVTTRPKVGAVAQWNAGEASAMYLYGSTRPNATMRAGSYGHVAFVRGVYADGSVSVAHYNMYGSRSYSVTRLKAPRYLYLS